MNDGLKVSNCIISSNVKTIVPSFIFNSKAVIFGGTKSAVLLVAFTGPRISSLSLKNISRIELALNDINVVLARCPNGGLDLMISRSSASTDTVTLGVSMSDSTTNVLSVTSVEVLDTLVSCKVSVSIWVISPTLTVSEKYKIISSGSVPFVISSSKDSKSGGVISSTTFAVDSISIILLSAVSNTVAFFNVILIAVAILRSFSRLFNSFVSSKDNSITTM